MNIITQANQRAVIHLSSNGNGFERGFLARAVVFTQRYDGSYSSHVVGVQHLTLIQVEELRSRATELQNFNIILVDATQAATDSTATSATLLLEIARYIPQRSVISDFVFIPSPYISKFQTQKAFVSSQKTRGPNSR